MAALPSELSTRLLVVVPATMAAVEALRVLTTARIHAAPVVRPDGRAVGVITLGDLVGSLGQLYVSDRMSSPTVAVAADATAAEVGRVMVDHGLHHVVVVQGGLPVGFLSALDVIGDLLRR